MATKIIDHNEVVSFDIISSWEDLKLKPRINLNLPPEDGNCECCVVHISELRPFGKAGDPLVGNFDGALLVKKFRPSVPYNEEAEIAYNKAEKHLTDSGKKDKDPYEWMIREYGRKRDNIYIGPASVYSCQ